MEKELIRGASGESLILIGESANYLDKYLPDSKVAVITDEEVYRLYPALFQPYKTIVSGRGESVKNLTTIASIYEKFIEYEVDRSTFILGVGGGVVCDITGFAASTYLRGLHFGFVPTTLLAQVDASVGGKNGVNFNGLKNRIGTFNQPDFVLCDPTFFQTLSEKEFHCGLGEIVKHALIADAEMFEYIENRISDIISRKAEVLQQLVVNSVRIKTVAVNRDEREQGERRILNFGHTAGHIIEERSTLTHGEAVAAGMVIAAQLSQQRGLLSDSAVNRIIALLKALGLPIQSPLSRNEFIDNLAWDKKRDGNALHFVFLTNIGQARIEKMPINQLQSLIAKE
ncbi:MAG: 3-dehydroquinate synthase [Bacteroidales bacterium]|nr:3-dehydroquinate synthase [Bacteroidales bacterium]MCL2133252.1 3-dehydroquinate synthase [Bacteroidales bacterium]